MLGRLWHNQQLRRYGRSFESQGRIGQIISENQHPDSCPRIGTIFALLRAATDRNRQTRFGPTRLGGHILSKLDKIWPNQQELPWERGGVVDGI